MKLYSRALPDQASTKKAICIKVKNEIPNGKSMPYRVQPVFPGESVTYSIIEED